MRRWILLRWIRGPDDRLAFYAFIDDHHRRAIALAGDRAPVDLSPAVVVYVGRIPRAALRGMDERTS